LFNTAKTFVFKEVNMTLTEKQKLIAEIVTILQAKLEIDVKAGGADTAWKVVSEASTVEMLTIKECAAEVKGVSEHSVRGLVKRGKLPYVRAGQGKNGKILISKKALRDYFSQPSVW
jgi:excisionase family DNA binding protein